MKVVVAGRGRVGGALHRALRKGGVHCRVVGGRSFRGMAGADVLILAVPDGSIAARAEALAKRIPPETVVLHCAGSRDAEELAPCRTAGAAVGVMHPLVSIPVRGNNPQLSGTTFAIGGDERAVRAARKLAQAVGARPLVADVHGPAYHAAAALVANGAAALASSGVAVLAGLGVDKRSAERALGALLRTVGENVENVGVPAALSGPIIRGDADTVTAHRRALRRIDARAAAAYDAVGPAILATAVAAKLPAKSARAVRRALTRTRRG